MKFPEPVPVGVGVKGEFLSLGSEIEKRRERRIWEEKEGGKMRRSLNGRWVKEG